MRGTRAKDLRRKFETWVKINNYPKEDQKTIWNSFKKRHKEIGRREKQTKGGSNRSTASVQ